MLRDGRQCPNSSKLPPTNLHKCPAINHLWGEADQAREGPWRVGASLLKSDLTLAGCAKCNGRQCKMQDFTPATSTFQAGKFALNLHGPPAHTAIQASVKQGQRALMDEARYF